MVFDTGKDEVLVKVIQKQENCLPEGGDSTLEKVTDKHVEGLSKSNKLVDSKEDHLIAWMEKKPGFTLDFKKDLLELSEKIGFTITGFEEVETPRAMSSNRVLKAYTDTFERVPETASRIVKEWLMKVVHWTDGVEDATVRIRGNPDKDKTKSLLNSGNGGNSHDKLVSTGDEKR